MNKQMTIPNDERYCSIEESIRESFKQIKLMKEGKLEKHTLNELWEEMKKWDNEDE